MRKIIFLTLVIVCWSSFCFAQQTSLQITSPPTGTVVHPGQTITVSIRDDPSLSNIGIIPENPLDARETANPLQFSVIIPARTPVREYNITAIGFNESGPVAGGQITLKVEPASSPVTLQAHPKYYELEVGETTQLYIIGTFSDGSQSNVQHSAQTTYSSSNTSVATVDNQGIVTAVAIGNATITITNSAATCTASVVVTKPVKHISGDGFFYPQDPSMQASFALNVLTGPLVASGYFKYFDTKTRMYFVAMGFTDAFVSANTGTVTGWGTINGVLGYRFVATVVDGDTGTLGMQITKLDGSAYYSVGPLAISGGKLAVN